MAKPTNTTGDRDYGRRTYASKKKYEEQRKLASDAHIDRVLAFKRQHSEYKKPYIDDLDYPEMEMYNPPPPWWPPVIPPIPPPEGPPIDPGGPIPPSKPPPDRNLPPFLGCMFFSRRIRPKTLQPGEIAYGGVDIGNQDSVQAIHIYGPGILGTDIAGCNQATKVKISGYKEYSTNRGFCGISVKAKDDPQDFNHVTPYFTLPKDDPGPYPIVVEVIMGSGAICTEMLYLETCPADPPLEYDSLSNPQTISPSSYLSIYVIGGQQPFTWAVSGTGFSFITPRTTVGSNRLDADPTACGSASITVTDACGEVVTGQVRSIAGTWVNLGDNGTCPLAGQWPDSGPAGSGAGCSSGQISKTSGKWRVSHCYNATQAYQGPPGCPEQCPNVCDTHCGMAICHTIFGCIGCLHLNYWQYSGGWTEFSPTCGAFTREDWHCDPPNETLWRVIQCMCVGSTNFKVEEWRCS